jgi:hypothetical protein
VSLFIDQIDGFLVKTAASLRGTYANVATIVLEEAHKGTPLLTGQMRASWRIGINSTDLTAAPQRDADDGSGLGWPDLSDETGTVDSAALFSQLGKLDSLGMFDKVNVTNNTFYARDVNTPGFSKKVDGGVIIPTMAAVMNRLNAGQHIQRFV